MALILLEFTALYTSLFASYQFTRKHSQDEPQLQFLKSLGLHTASMPVIPKGSDMQLLDLGESNIYCFVNN